MILWDNHMHSNASGDCKADPADMILSAKTKSLGGITFTDHLDLDYREEPGLFDLDLPTYQKSIRQMQEQTENLSVLWGIELGLQPHLSRDHSVILQEYPFDYVIGSTHVVHGVDPYYPAFFQGRTTQYAYTEYYEAILENLYAFSNIDALGHLDYVFRYGPRDAGTSVSDSYTPFASLIDEILHFLIEKDIALEVNTGALRCGLKEPNPCRRILKRYHDLGGRLITIGADAHTPSHVALGYEILPDFLKSCGFNEYMVYKKRIPYPHLLR